MHAAKPGGTNTCGIRNKLIFISESFLNIVLIKTPSKAMAVLQNFAVHSNIN